MKKPILLTVIFFISSGLTVFSQDKKETEDAKNEKVWTMQADCYAARLGVKKSTARKLSEAYEDFREEMNSATENEFKEVLTKKLSKLLTNEQQEEAILVLGSLNARWDTYQETIINYSLSKEDLKSASANLCAYMVKYITARKEAEEAGMRFSPDASRSIKAELDEGLSKILSEDQMHDWSNQTQRKKKN